MRKILLSLTLVTATLLSYAQDNVGINTTNPHASAALEVQSTTQGMLVPRMTLAQRNAINMVSGISTPASGLLIYQTDNTPGFYFYNGTAWTSLSASGSSIPAQTGNAGKYLSTDGTSATWASVSGATLELFATSTSTQTKSPYAYNRYTFNFDNVVSGQSKSAWEDNNTYIVPAGKDGLYQINLALIVNNYAGFPQPVPVYPEIQVTSGSKITYYYGTSSGSVLLQGDGTDGISVGSSGAPISYVRGIANIVLQLKAEDKIKVFYRTGSNSTNTSQAISFTIDGSTYLNVSKLN